MYLSIFCSSDLWFLQAQLWTHFPSKSSTNYYLSVITYNQRNWIIDNQAWNRSAKDTYTSRLDQALLVLLWDLLKRTNVREVITSGSTREMQNLYVLRALPLALSFCLSRSSADVAFSRFQRLHSCRRLNYPDWLEPLSWPSPKPNSRFSIISRWQRFSAPKALMIVDIVH